MAVNKNRANELNHGIIIDDLSGRQASVGIDEDNGDLVLKSESGETRLESENDMGAASSGAALVVKKYVDEGDLKREVLILNSASSTANNTWLRCMDNVTNRVPVIFDRDYDVEKIIFSNKQDDHEITITAYALERPINSNIGTGDENHWNYNFTTNNDRTHNIDGDAGDRLYANYGYAFRIKKESGDNIDDPIVKIYLKEYIA